MYERIEKCEMKGKDWKNSFFHFSSSRADCSGGGEAKKEPSKWKILMFNQLLMSEISVAT